MDKCGNDECGFYKSPCEGLLEDERCGDFKPLMEETKLVAEVPCSDGVILIEN
jgi:hypothetical protein